MPLIRYPLDPTGVNPDNRVVDELKSLTNTTIKALVPTYGPIFTDGLIVVDALNNQVLVKGTDYSCTQLLQEATLRYGKEVCEVILIRKPNVSTSVRITYQVLGGLYQNSVAGIESLYQGLINDNRPIVWDAILNKPYEYPAALHMHMLQDVVGFEPVIVALERIRNAITLSDLPAFEALVDWVNSKLEVVTEAEIDAGLPVNKIVTYERLIHAIDNISLADVAGILPIASGGTGSTTASGAFDNLKQQATTLYTGVMSMSTDAEAYAGTVETKPVNPKQLITVSEDCKNFAVVMSIALG